MVKNVIPLEHISRGITFLYMKKVAITNGSISYIPKNERQEWFMRTTFFYPLHADLLRRWLERGEKSKPLTLVFLHS